ncbi:MAG TPA: ABC transporter permease subunit, partial [Solirubrobacterales bacterium]|nr:ABC transporter permease subunit [Solirubrobacterales bacterium]
REAAAPEHGRQQVGEDDAAEGRERARAEGPLTTFRRIILPNLLPAVFGGSGLAFSRALGEFGSLVLVTGNIPFQDQVASFYIYSQIESDNRQGAAAVSVFLLVLSLAALLLLSGLERWTSRHAH